MEYLYETAMSRRHSTNERPPRRAKSRNLLHLSLLALLLVCIPTRASRAQGALSVQVNSINAFTIQMPPALVISTATAGQDPDPVSATTTWGFTTNGSSNRNLVASLDNQPPSGLAISVDLGTPTDVETHGAGSSAGAASIGTFDNSVYENVTLWSGARRARAAGNVTWTASATTALGEDDDYTGNLTFTFE